MVGKTQKHSTMDEETQLDQQFGDLLSTLAGMPFVHVKVGAAYCADMWSAILGDVEEKRSLIEYVKTKVEKALKKVIKH